ncbi:MAG: hypothetical protein U9R49_03040 [Bacteroidota bacterium]|nr:hypothetical protein [Bacteroidota bacterium]
MKQVSALSFILIIFLMASCEIDGGPGGNDASNPEVKILLPTKVTETGFQLNWTIVNPATAQSIAVELSEDSEMQHITQYLDVGDITNEHILVSNLEGATRYYYRILFMVDGLAVFRSEIASTETFYQVDNIELVTEDSYTLSGMLAYLESVSGSMVGEDDIHDDIEGGDFPAETQTLYDLTEAPRKLEIIEGTSDHGTNLLTRDELNTSIKEWILERLPLQ